MALVRDASPRTAVQPTAGGTTLRASMAEVLAAMSRALDLCEGQPLGHSVRSCFLGMRLGQSAGLEDAQLAALFYACLLKDAGGSSNAARVSALFASDDHLVKPRLRMVDWDDRRTLALAAWKNTAIRGSLWARLGHFAGMTREQNVARTLIATRCERGAVIAARLGFTDGTASAIHSLDEHWNGKGGPDGLRGDAIPLLSRIVNIAQTMDMFLARSDAQAAESMLRARRGEWFDPTLSDLACELLRDDRVARSLKSPDLEQRVVELEPATLARVVDDQGLDDIARAFAEIIDAKSPFTPRHSAKVADYARGIGQELGFDDVTLRNTYRAGLLHDIGNLGVSSRILEKNGPLTLTERAEIEHHPVSTWEILRNVNAFSAFAMQASTHHEKLDGSGYPWGRTEEDLDPMARVLVVADVFEAATADRAYRTGLSDADALQVLNAQRGLWLDADAIDALACLLQGDAPQAL